MMEVETPHQFDWAHDAFVALNDPNTHAEKWAAMHNAAFGIPPSVLTQASVERYGQVTPPEELSPVDQPRDTRERSIPVEQLRNETLWPQQQTQHSQQSDSSHQSSQEPSSKRRRTSRQTTTNQSPANDSTPPQHDANPQPPKRKRGRPKSQPQMVEAFTADGFPFQVSSARQSHLEKNRVAAHKCRQRKKEYINGLEGRAREFSSKNKALKENVAMLREEVLGLKNEVLRHAGCGFWAVDEYLARCAGDLLGMEAPMRTPGPQHPNQQNPAMNTEQLMGQRHNSTDSIPSQSSDASSPDPEDDFGGLELLRDFDNDDMDELEAAMEMN
ncbi:hypothetical protein EK21DRAFT_68315 [Setomelanomma holmii]|uniref:BZIP domain-containing protein n=1 Tax=Setomelanomma holmii TaxID=210430 RepID=A0A9P4LMQ5_9PLEO|nr:hypothetical protein EK21DRAFT_68315 [Setomelanomma holmii]